MRTVVGFLCWFLACPSFSQTLPTPPKADAPQQSAKEYAQRCLRYIQAEDFAHALPDIERAMKRAPNVAMLHYLRGGILVKLGRHDRAFADFDRAIHLEPSFAPAYPGRACVYFLRKQYDRVLADCERAIQLDPTLADAFRYRGMVYQQQRKRAEALNDFKEAIRLEPQDNAARIARAQLYRQSSEWDLVLRDCNAVLERQPDNLDCLLLRLKAHEAKQDDKNLLADAQELLRQIKPKNSEDYRLRGEMHRLRATVKKQYWIRHPDELVKETQKLLKEINEFDKKWEQDRNNIGLHRDDGDKNEQRGVDPFAMPPPFSVPGFSMSEPTLGSQESGGLRKGMISPLSNLTQRTEKPGSETARTKHNFSTPHPISPLPLPPSTLSKQSGDAQNPFDKSAEIQAERRQALADYNEAIRLEPANVEAYQNRAQLYLDLGDFPKCLADHNAVIRLQPDKSQSYIDRAEAYRDRWNPFAKSGPLSRSERSERDEDYRKAIADYTQALQLHPDNAAVIHLNRGNLYLALSDWDRTIADCTEALRLHIHNEQVYHVRLLAYRNKKDYARAIADCTAFIQCNPSDRTHQGWYAERAEMYEAQKDYTHALADYTTLIRVRPNEASGYRLRGDFFLRTRAFERALSDYAEGLRLAQEQEYLSWLRAELHAGRGQVFLQKGDFDAALAEYGQALANDDKKGDYYAWRALVHLYRNERKLAVEDGHQAAFRYRVHGSRLVGNVLLFLLGECRLAVADYWPQRKQEERANTMSGMSLGGVSPLPPYLR